MPKQVIAFAASSSRKSINRQLVTYAGDLLRDAEVEVLDLNDFEMPLFSVDREAELGEPRQAREFYARIGACDGILVSFAEHNGNYSAAYKSLFDWVSRIDARVYQDKPMVVLATSPGKRGGRGVLDIALDSLPRYGAVVRASLSLPKFGEYFDRERGEVRDPALRRELEEAVNRLFAGEAE